MNPDSVLGFEVIKQCCNEIRALLRTLLTTPSSFPELEWLDIELQSNINNQSISRYISFFAGVFLTSLF